jgi:hypothetical protein
MTYNFDPELWLTMRQEALRRRAECGELSSVELDEELRRLEERYEELLDRLDGTYQIPPSQSS